MGLVVGGLAEAAGIGVVIRRQSTEAGPRVPSRPQRGRLQQPGVWWRAPLRRRRLRVALSKTGARGDSRAVLRRGRSDASSRARVPQAGTPTKAILTSRRKQEEIQDGSCLLQHELLESIF